MEEEKKKKWKQHYWMKTTILDENSTAGWKQSCRMKKQLLDENSAAKWKTALLDEKMDDCFWKLGCEEKLQKTPTSISHNFFNSTPILMFFSPKLINFLSSTQWTYPI
jgi:hypothetical protein